eukprot:scaffold25783_cov118-Isochrysis_galbana.AAC.2
MTPLREARIKPSTPVDISHRHVASPRPPPPPLTKWLPLPRASSALGIRRTSLPMWVPCCRHEKAATIPHSSSSTRSGSPRRTRASTRAAITATTRCIHSGDCSSTRRGGRTERATPTPIPPKLDEPATLTHQRERGGNEVEREAIEHCIKATSSNPTCHAGRKRAAVARAEPNAAEPDAPQTVVLAWLARRCTHLRTQPTALRHGREPNAARSRVHKEPIARARPASKQRCARGAPRGGQAARVFVREPRPHRHEQPPVSFRDRSQ